MTRLALAAVVLVAVSFHAGCAGMRRALMGGPGPAEYKATLDHFGPSPPIDAVLRRTIEEALANPKTVAQYRGMAVAAALASLGPGGASNLPVLGSYQGSRTYPAGSLAALCYAVYRSAHRDDRRLRDLPRLDDRVATALRSGSPESINALLDALTGTESGPPLEGRQFEAFRNARFAINTWLAGVGLHPALRVGYKIYETMPSPRDTQLAGISYTQGNEVAASALAELLALPAMGRLYSPEESARVLAMLALQPTAPATVRDVGVAASLPQGTRAWGMHSTARDHHHEALVFEVPGGGRFVLVILTDRGEHGRAVAAAIAPAIMAAVRDRVIPVPPAPPK